MHEIKNKLVPEIQKLLLSLYADESKENFTLLKTNQKFIIHKIKNWKNVMAAGSHKDLNETGKLLMTDLGKRWNSKLKKLTKHLKQEEVEVNVVLL